jgi:orotate phosphoribosyltransferase
MNVEQVLNEFKKSGALLEGHFILSSGLHSDKFLQKALVFQDAKRTAKLCKALAEKVKKEVKVVSSDCPPCMSSGWTANSSCAVISA